MQAAFISTSPALKRKTIEMTYTLVALFIASGAIHTERTHLSLQACAGQAAMSRQAIPPSLTSRIGEVRFVCVKEKTRNG